MKCSYLLCLGRSGKSCCSPCKCECWRQGMCLRGKKLLPHMKCQSKKISQLQKLYRQCTRWLWSSRLYT